MAARLVWNNNIILIVFIGTVMITNLVWLARGSHAEITASHPFPNTTSDSRRYHATPRAQRLDWLVKGGEKRSVAHTQRSDGCLCLAYTRLHDRVSTLGNPLGKMLPVPQASECSTKSSSSNSWGFFSPQVFRVGRGKNPGTSAISRDPVCSPTIGLHVVDLDLGLDHDKRSHQWHGITVTLLSSVLAYLVANRC
ncbi:hypothetical protein F5B17DRAFT_161434 [Nemania serpens]|nr:hypothetical protein F5B17DRAFT_161434 [Nemania serpens]